jgi:uncharacterized protein
VSAYLLDVNVMIALALEDHIAHKAVKRWFQRIGGKSWSTCALTEAGFVRIISNPGFLKHPPDLSEALDMLKALTSLPGHHFWTLDLNFADAVQALEPRLFGHQQVTDAYLLGLAVRKKGKLATLDLGIKTLAGDESASYLEIIQ